MEIKINPYMPISHIENNKGKNFDNKKNIRLKGKIIDIKESSTSTYLIVDLLQKKDDISELLGEIVYINL
jgi:hypothetical protein